MPKIRSRPWNSLIAALLLGLAGCNSTGHLPGAQWPVVTAAPAKEGVFHLAGFETGATVRAGFAMAYEHGEYARFQDKDRIAELVYDTAIDDGDEISVQHEHHVKSMIKGWHFNRSKTISWGGGGNSGLGEDDYATQSYRLGSGHACIGFLYEWDHPPGDSKNYPGKIAFGYFCQKQPGPLTDGQARAFLDAIDIARLEQSGVHLPQNGTARIDAKTMRLAQGGDGFGHKEFPFDYAFPFQEDNGDDRAN